MVEKKYPIAFNEESIYFSYDVTDFKRAKEFYTNIFNFEITFDAGNEIGWCELDLPVKGVKLGLNLKQEGEMNIGSGKIVFMVNDLDATKDYLENKDVKTENIVDIPDMVSYFNMYDSEGNIIQIISDPRVKSK
ncbi:MAG: VOC family protein [Promethearchaeota archaeon]